MRGTAFKGQERLRPLGSCLAALLLSAGVLSAGILPAAAFERAPLPSEAPMEPCPSQGANFFRIPGTTTCLRLSGRVRAGIDAGPGRTAAPVQGRVSVDARGDSALGPVRSFVRIEAGAR
jgi:hypothetical protein